jgi:hypothetical protein
MHKRAKQNNNLREESRTQADLSSFSRSRIGSQRRAEGVICAHNLGVNLRPIVNRPLGGGNATAAQDAILPHKR